MKTFKPANNRTKQGASQHDGERKAVSINSVHPDVILDAGNVLYSVLKRLTKLEAEVTPLKKENEELRKRNKYLETQHRKDRTTIHRLNAEIKTLNARLEKLEKPKKDSHNSSIPPAKEDIASAEKRKRTNSLRKPSEKKSGGQPGHEGHTLAKTDSVDEFVTVPLDECPECGEDLSNVPGIEKMSRQVIDISFPAPIITQYSILEKVCPNCGRTIHGEFPEVVNGEVSYGPNVQALVVYLCEEHAVSYQRVKKLMKDMFNISMSEGTINNIIQRITKRARKLYEKIKEKIGRSPVVGADETGIDIAGILHWLWVWQTETASFFKPHAKRGYKAIEDTFDEGLPDTVLVTDRHGAYFGMDVKDHQVCLVHLQRNLTYLTEVQPENKWPKDMLQLITEAMKERREKQWDQIDRQRLRQCLDELLDSPLGTEDKEFVRIKNGLASKKDYLFTFLDNPNVPYDNNASERAIRPTKTKLKVAGLFRTFLGAEAYAIIHSIIDTAKKQTVSPFQELQMIAQLKPSMLTL